MKNLLYKELRLATPPISFIFLAFTLMCFFPGYPILCGAFFVCFGIFQSYQLGREDNDILYTLLLPVKKAALVRAKYLAAVALQLGAFLLFTLFTGFRMAFLADAAVYRANALMGANAVFLAFVLLIFAAFNTVFIGGFFKSAWRYGKPFVFFAALSFLIIAAAELLHHLPGLSWLNALGIDGLPRQLPILAAAALIYAGLTAASCRASERRFERMDF